MTGNQQPLDSSSDIFQQLDVEFAIQATGLGIWEYNPLTGIVTWDERARALYGIAKGHQMPYEQAIQYIHPDDVARIDQAVRWAINPQSDGSYDQIYRTIGVDDGQLRWVHFSGRAYFAESGEFNRFAGIARDCTPQALDKQKLIDEQALLHSIIQQTPAPTLVLRGDNYRIEQINQSMLSFMGRGEEVIGQPLLAVMPELAGQFAWQQVQRVYQEGIDFDQSEVLVPHVRNGVLQNLYYNVSYRPLRQEGQIMGVIQVATDITDQVVSRRQVEEGQRQVLAYFEQSPVGIAIISKDNLTFRMANPFYGYLVGRAPQDIVGKSLLEALPELEGQGFDGLLREVLATGMPFIAKEVEVAIVRQQQLETIWVDLTYQPQREADNHIAGILVVATDVTQQVLSRKKIEESESKLRAILATAPAGIGLFVGRDLVIENPNQTFIDIVGKGPQIEGLPLREAMPELISEGQPFLQILDDVFTTGKPFISPGSLVKIVQNGVLRDNYYNISYSPVRNAAGEVYAILDIAIDVTQEVQLRQQTQQAQQLLQGAIELAEMGTWELDMTTGVTTYSQRLKDLFEFTQDFIERERLYNPIHADDRSRLEAAVARVTSPDSDGILDEEYTIITQRTGRHRIVRAQAKIYFDGQGKPHKLVGSMRDLTEQRQVQLALEQLVQERTEELAATNEEVQATNEELTASNEELEEANTLLMRSNDNLQQFAYVASHDLQEPLRKIQSFGDLLNSQYGDQLGQRGSDYIDRMQVAAARMSTLIKDLLTFSRISTQRETNTSVDLNRVIGAVLLDLDLAIQEANATVEMETLPTMDGDQSQLGQLFQNLLNNALKFRQAGQAPHIRISCQIVKASDLPPTVKPARLTQTYYCVAVRDNGVGFDERFADRIFQVFQRLHGKDQYVGTGIGLAICERVVANHGGAITANSQPGEGATFSIYLPS